MTNKFTDNLTSSSAAIKGQRAALISSNAQRAQEELLRKLTQESTDLQLQKMALSDIYPDSELSLLVTKNSFNADKWVSDIQNIEIKLLNKQVEINAAQKTYDEWFKDTTISPE